MHRRRIRIEFEDEEGGKYTISIDGNISKEKVLKMMELIETLAPTEEDLKPSPETAFDKVIRLIEERFAIGNFTSNDILEAYEDTYNEPIKPSTIATYLTRLTDRGMLRRHRTRQGWVYRLSTKAVLNP
jgi:hypothetical protein